MVEEFFEKAGLKLRPSYEPTGNRPYLHPGRQAEVICDGQKVGYMGQVHPLVCQSYDMPLDAAVYVAVIDMPSIIEKATFDHHFNGIAKFPAVTRDISMVVPKEVLVGQIEAVLGQRGGKILEGFNLFDIYEGEQVKAGFKSIAYSLSFRNKERTLSDDDVNAAMKKILNGLEGLGIELRS